LIALHEYTYLKRPEEERKRSFKAFLAYYQAERETNPLGRALHLYLLLQTAFNGIWYARAGDGKYQPSAGKCNERSLVRWEDLAYFKTLVDKAEITCKDYQDVLGNIPSNSVIFIDPPYIKTIENKKRMFPENFSLEQTHV